MSPEIFQTLINKRKNLRRNPFKSEIFSLGLIILEIIVMRDIQEIYNRISKKFDQEKFYILLEEILEILKENDIIKEALLKMVDLEEKERKTPLDLLKIFQ